MNSEYSAGAPGMQSHQYKENISNPDDKPQPTTRSSSAGPMPQPGGGDEEDDDEGSRGGRERRKIEIKFIQDKGRRHITFSKRKHGIMKKAWELSILTGTQVLLLVVSETGLVYTYSTPKLQPLVTQAEGKKLIQDCLNAPDLPREEELKAVESGAVGGGNNAVSSAGSQAAAAAAAVASVGTGGPGGPGGPHAVPVPANAQRIPQGQPGMMPQSPMSQQIPPGAMRQPVPGQYMAGLEPGSIMLPPEQIAQMQEGYMPADYAYIQGQQPPPRYPL